MRQLSDLHLQPFLVILRLLGGFPYVKRKREKTERREEEKTTGRKGRKRLEVAGQEDGERREGREEEEYRENQEDEEEDNTHLRRSKPWVWWSRVMVVAGALYLIYSLVHIDTPIVGLPSSLHTANLAYKLVDTHDAVTITALLFFVVWKSSELRRIMGDLVHLLSDLDIGSSKPHSLPSVVLPLGVSLLTTSIILTHVFIDLSWVDSGRVACEAFECVVNFFLGMVVLLLYRWMVYLVCRVYDRVITLLSDPQVVAYFENNGCTLDEIQSKRSQHSKLHLEVSEPSTQPSEHEGRTMEKLESSSAPDMAVWTISEEEEQKPKHRVTPCDIEEAHRRLIQIAEFLEVVSGYYEMPVTLMMLYSVVSCILACFYLSFLLQVDVMGKVVTFTYVFTSLLTSLCLCNVPRYLQLKREEVRVRVRTLQYHPAYRHLRHKVGEVGVVVRVRGDAPFLGLFTLGRGVVVGILGFIATYVVILLQFRFNETATASTTVSTTALSTVAPPLNSTTAEF